MRRSTLAAIAVAAVTLPAGLMAGSAHPVMAETAVGSVVIPYQATGWKYQQVDHGGDDGFQATSYNDSGWATGQAAFGSVNPASCTFNDPTLVHTNWDVNTDMLIRRHFTMPAGAASLHLDGTIDNDADVYLNGSLLLHVDSGFCATGAISVDIPASELAVDNVLAIRGIDEGVADYLDVQLSVASTKTPIYGGTPVDVVSETGQTTDGACTAGYAAKRVSTGALYMVTANHCRNVLNMFGVSVGSANPVNIYPAGNRTAPYATDVDCSGADAACLRATKKPTDMFAWFPDSAIPTAQVLVSSQLENVTAEASYEDLRHNGQLVCWTGRGSGTEKCATVLGRWSELSIRQKLSVIRDGGGDIPLQFGTGYVILKGQAPVRGDSGSLVYLKAANGVEAVGMVIAAGHSDLSVMIPVQVIDANLGIVTLTTQ